MKIAIEIIRQRKFDFSHHHLIDILISKQLSPFFSEIYIKKNIKPNTITIHMILSGIVGAIFFSLPFLSFKIIGVILLQLWYVLDCSDGEVARWTKCFSTFGQELDYMAHIINHPLYGLSMLFSLLQLHKYPISFIIFLILFSNITDLINRNLFAINIIKSYKLTSTKVFPSDKRNSFLKILLGNFVSYPNLILFSVLFYFIDMYLGTNIVVFLFALNIISTSFNILILSVKYLKCFHKE